MKYSAIHDGSWIFITTTIIAVIAILVINRKSLGGRLVNHPSGVKAQVDIGAWDN